MKGGGILFNKFKKIFLRKQQNEETDRYIIVQNDEINEDLKQHINALEKLGERYSKDLENEYKSKFESDGKKNLKIWVCRDIDGDQIQGLTSDQCLEGEYRSQIAINYDGFTDEEDAYVYYIKLWGFSRGRKSIGGLYDLSKYNLKKEIEDTLSEVLKAT